MSLYTPDGAHAETIPTAVEIQPVELGEIACSILASLDTLTLDACVRARAEFETQQDYETYMEQVRFNRGQAKDTWPDGRRLLQLKASYLLQDHFRGWGLIASRTDDSEGNKGYFRPQDERAAYLLQLTLWRLTPRQYGPLEVIQVASADPISASEPQLTYYDSYEGAGAGAVETAELAGNYHFGVVKEVEDELRRNASALVDLRLDEIAAIT